MLFLLIYLDFTLDSLLCFLLIRSKLHCVLLGLAALLSLKPPSSTAHSKLPLELSTIPTCEAVHPLRK